MGLKIGVVTSRFNEDVTFKLESGAIDYLSSLDLDVEILSVRVPGVVEIPLACQALFDQGCEGVVALGAVIRGETPHFDYVCNSVERGITELILQTKKPIGFGVLTTENEEQALDRAGGMMGNKGVDSAQVVLEMIGLLDNIRNNNHKISPPQSKPQSAAIAKKAKSKKKKNK